MIPSARIDTALRLAARPAAEAWERSQAALIARIYRRVPLAGEREESGERWERNRLARGNARRHMARWQASQRAAFGGLV